MVDDPLVVAFDRLSFKLVGAIGRIFGSLAGKGEEVYWAQIKSSVGNGFVDLAATVGATAAASISITQEADFVAVRALQMSIDPTSGAPISGPSWKAQIRDGSSDRDLSAFKVALDCLAGNAQNSVPFPKNRLFRRNSTITIDFENNRATATRIYFALLGYKVFDESALDLTRRR